MDWLSTNGYTGQTLDASYPCDISPGGNTKFYKGIGISAGYFFVFDVYANQQYQVTGTTITDKVRTL